MPPSLSPYLSLFLPLSLSLSLSLPPSCNMCLSEPHGCIIAASRLSRALRRAHSAQGAGANATQGGLHKARPWICVPKMRLAPTGVRARQVWGSSPRLEVSTICLTLSGETVTLTLAKQAGRARASRRDAASLNSVQKAAIVSSNR